MFNSKVIQIDPFATTDKIEQPNLFVLFVEYYAELS